MPKQASAKKTAAGAKGKSSETVSIAPWPLKFNYAVLVYQGGIANVFRMSNMSADPAERKDQFRLLQGAFSTCEDFAQGLAAAGVEVVCMHCNMAGDVSWCAWGEVLADAPYRDRMRPVGNWMG